MGLDMKIEKRYYGGSDELFYCSKEHEINDWFIKQYLKDNADLTFKEIKDRGYSPDIVVTTDLLMELVFLLRTCQLHCKNHVYEGYYKGLIEDLLNVLDYIEDGNDIVFSSNW